MLKLCIAALLAAPAPLLAQDFTPQEAAKVDAMVAESLEATGVPSASVAVVRGGRITFAKAYGKQSDAMPVADAKAPYQIASVSKQFTAAAMLMLEDEGKLSLDDPVSKWVPGISGGDTIRLRQLLSHTSGLQDYWPQDYSFAAMAKPVTPQGIVERWAKKPLDFPPGTQWQYSNTGYVVAGLVIEKAAGMPLLDYLQAHIFKPLGIHAEDQDLAVGKGYPTPYQRFALGPVRSERPAARGWLFAAGELAMSASDLAKWDIARMDRALLPADDWAAQETSVKLTGGSDTGYGLGVSVGEKNGVRYVEHSGEAVGFLSENIVFPAQKAAVVVLVNGDFGGSQGEIANGIAKMLVPALAGSGTTLPDRTGEARAVFDQLVGGSLDRAKLTEDANYYFTPTALGDYKASLAALGTPTSFTIKREPRLRGGFVNRNYTVTYPGGRTLNVITYAEAGDSGKWEQFLVQPAQ